MSHDAVIGRCGPAPISQFLTGDQNLIHIRVVVQYSVGVPADYLFQADNVEKLSAPPSRPNWRKVGSRGWS